MASDLPKSVPYEVTAAANWALERAESLDHQRDQASRSYHSAEFRRHTDEVRTRLAFYDLLGKAQAVVDWGAMVRDSLPLDRLNRRFRTPDGRCQCISVVRCECHVGASEGFPGGRLTTELELPLDPAVGAFRHHEWFEGFRMTGGGVLNTASGLHLTLYPGMLIMIYGQIVSASNWRHIEVSLNRLIDIAKDR